MLADQVDYVVGVDPRRDSHALAIVHVLSGAVVFEAMIAASSQGYAEALQLVEVHAAGRRAFAVEGSGSFEEADGMTSEMGEQPTSSERNEEPTVSTAGEPTSSEASEPAGSKIDEPTSAGGSTTSSALAVRELPAVKLPSTVRLHSGEAVVMAVRPSKWWTWPRYLFTLGLWYFWRKRHVYVLSNERVLGVKGIINTSEASAPLARIQDLHVKRSIWSGGRLEWSTAGGQMGVTKIASVTRNDAVLLADAMTPLIGRDHRATP